MKGAHDVVYARKTTKFYLMIHGLSSDEIDRMENTDVVLFREFIEKYEETKTKRLAHEISKAMWGIK